MSSSETTPLQISGYFVLPLRLPPLPSYPISATHFLYIASHQPRVPTPTAARSLFLVNVPFDATASHIKHLLSTQLGLPNGRVEDVQFEAESKRAQNDDETSGSQSKLTQKGKKRKHSMEYKDFAEFSGGDLPHVWDRDLRSPGSTAVVMLVDRASMEAVIKAIKRIRKEGREPIWGEGVEDSQPALGLSRYLKHCELQYPDKAELLDSVNTYMTAFADHEASQAKLRARQRQKPDEDGFIMVTKGGRNGPARQDIAQEHAEKQKEKQKGFEDFYRFQTREKRKARAGELVRKFEEDKEKIRGIKERRGGFMPES